MNNRFEFFDQANRRFSKIVAALVFLLVALLIGVDMARHIDLSWLTGAEPTPQVEQTQRSPDGCIKMPNGLLVCDPKIE